MNVFLGIDGGGTKTKVVAIDENMKVVFENTSGPTSIDTVSENETYNNLSKALENFDNEKLKIEGIFTGLGGIVFLKDEVRVEKIVREITKVTSDISVIVKNDMENALYSGLNYDHGMAMICGTGMVVFGVNKGKNHKAGGWGHREGELGSAYNLGVELIRHTIRAYDYRKNLDEMAIECAKILGMSKPSDIIKIMNEIFDSRTDIAALAPIVTKHANSGNHEARRICDFATDELTLAVKAVYDKLRFEETTLVVVGSLGNSEGYFKDSLHEKIKKASEKITIISPIIDPAEAAARMALKIYREKTNPLK